MKIGIIKVTPEEKVKLLKCDEYRKYLLFKNNEVFIDVNKIPKTHYLSIDGDYCFGFKICSRINKVISDSDIVKIVVSKTRN